MAYDVIEASREDGRPVRLYRFALGAAVWFYTSADEDLVVGGITYKRAAISDDGVSQRGEDTADNFVIRAPAWIGPAQMFVNGAPSKGIGIIVYSKHEQSPDTVVEYVGEVVQIGQGSSAGQVVLTCELLGPTLNREGLRLGWQRACPYVVYDQDCKLDKTPLGRSFVVTAIDGFVVTIDFDAGVIAENYLEGGFIEWQHPIRGPEYLWVDEHPTTGQIVLNTDPGDLHVGAVGIGYPSCKYEPTSCQALGNYDNYGGNPDMPGKSPFDGDPVFY